MTIRLQREDFDAAAEAATIARGVARPPVPQARFSPTLQPRRPRIHPVRRIRVANDAP